MVVFGEVESAKKRMMDGSVSTPEIARVELPANWETVRFRKMNDDAHSDVDATKNAASCSDQPRSQHRHCPCSKRAAHLALDAVLDKLDDGAGSARIRGFAEAFVKESMRM